MELKNIYPQDIQGNVIPNPTVFVYEPDTTTTVEGLQTAAGAALANPFVGSPLGHVQFAAPDGVYDVRVVGAGKDTTMRVRFIDAAAVANQLAAMQGVIDGLSAVPAQTGAPGILYSDGEEAVWIAGYTKDQIDAGFYSRDEIDAAFYSVPEVDAGFYTKTAANTLLNGKAATDLSNVTQANARTKVGTGTMAYRGFTYTAGAPVSGADGDIHFKY